MNRRSFLNWLALSPVAVLAKPEADVIQFPKPTIKFPVPTGVVYSTYRTVANIPAFGTVHIPGDEIQWTLFDRKKI